MRNRKNYRREFKLLFLLFLALTMLSSIKADVISPDSSVAGKTLPEWTAEWWKWAVSFPAGSNPLVDDSTGEFAHQGDVGPVFFLAGTFGGEAKRTFSIPPGKFIFFPVVNSIFIATEPDETEELARGVVKNDIDAATGIHATIDGVPVPNLTDHRHASLAFSLNFPVNNAFGLPPGTFDIAVTDGFWLMLTPLSPGQHTINFGGTLPTFGILVEVTDNINVVPEPTTFLLLLGFGIVVAPRLRSRRCQ